MHIRHESGRRVSYGLPETETSRELRNMEQRMEEDGSTWDGVWSSWTEDQYKRLLFMVSGREI